MAWNILYLITVVTGALTVLGILAKWWWPLDIFDHFRAQYLFLLVVIGIILILGGKYIEAMAAITFGLLNFIVILTIFFSPEEKTLADGQIYR
ncbi:unnamed protein product, partial [marine sediment metagenome]